MKAEFHDPDEPDQVLASVTWIDGQTQVTADDAGLAEKLRQALRPTPVVVDDSSYRQLGTHGVVVVQPGDLEWFRAATMVRAPAETGLVARLVPEVERGGYDPAAGYRTFGAAVERLSDS
jgi:hypothetical protein